jgi:uncharacterized membrane protein
MATALKSDIHNVREPFKWIALGWRDMRRHPALSLAYGATLLVAGAGLWLLLWSVGRTELIPAAAAGFALAGPVLASGLYDMSRRIERKERVRFVDVASLSWLREGTFVVGLIVMFALLGWLRIAGVLVEAFFPNPGLSPVGLLLRILTTSDGHILLAVGTGVGFVFAATIFAIAAFSLPMLVDRDIDALTAIGESIKIVTSHPFSSLLWAGCIAALLVACLATAFLGLIVVFPILGHASWHAYRSVTSG